MTDENSYPPSKKRAAGREISRDNPGLDDEDEDVSELEAGTFKRASDEVIAARKIVKVRRQPAASAPSAPSSNPFAGIRLAPPVPTTTTDVSNNEDIKDKQDKETNEEDKLDEKETDVVKESSTDKEKIESAANAATEETSVDKDELDQTLVKESEDVPAETNDQTAKSPEKDEPKTSVNGEEKANEEGNAFSSFQQLSSSKNAFTGLSGPGFSPSAFSFGSIPKEGSPSSLPSFGFTSPNNGTGSLFGSTGASGNKTEGSAAAFPSMQEVSVETGEENEETIFTADSALFEYSEGGWKERGKGEVKLNRLTSGPHKARLVMRARGNYRLILNAYLYPDMKLTKMDKKGVTFACANSAAEGKTGLTTFALKFKEASIVETFSAAVAAHKGDEVADPEPGLNTPGNSPKEAEE